MGQHDDEAQAVPAALDIAGLEHALNELRACPDLARDAAGAVARREEAVAGLVHEVELRLAARGNPAVLAQGLRRLEDTLYRAPDFSDPDDPPFGALPPRAVALLERFDDLFREAQAAARGLLQAELGLAMMTPQVGQAIDPVRHNVIGSVTGDDPARDNTVAQVEAPGWMLADAVLARADVIRYSCSSAGFAMQPALDDERSRGPDDAMVGRKTGGGGDGLGAGGGMTEA